MEKVIIRDDFIKLGQAMKLAGMVGSGVDAKMLIQDGQVEALQGDEASWLAVRKDQGRQWNIYDWKGELSCTLEGEEDSWLSLSGPLLELRCRNYTAYYEPESGTCVFRTWFSLGDRGGEAQEPAG